MTNTVNNVIANNMKTIYDEDTIRNAVLDVAYSINKRELMNREPLAFICVLNGSFMFFTDLVKEIRNECYIDFMQVKSYKNGLHYEPQIIKDIDLDLNGKDVYIVDDICDSGNTLLYIENYLKSKYSVKSINKVALIHKTTSPVECIHGLKLENEAWLNGYGLDDLDGLKRNKKSISGYEINID
jgi:hypoxanthine phosphoribosyltransferase